MKKLTTAQRKAWQAIAKNKKHPWYGLALKALERDKFFAVQKRKINKMFKDLKNKI